MERKENRNMKSNTKRIIAMLAIIIIFILELALSNSSKNFISDYFIVILIVYLLILGFIVYPDYPHKLYEYLKRKFK